MDASMKTNKSAKYFIYSENYQQLFCLIGLTSVNLKHE